MKTKTSSQQSEASGQRPGPSPPTGLPPLAQGCDEGATLGHRAERSATLKGLQPVASFARAFFRWLQPRWGWEFSSPLTQGSSFVATLGWRMQSRWDWFAALVIVLLLPAVCAHAQTYSIDWSKIAGGGGTSTGGV